MLHGVCQAPNRLVMTRPRNPPNSPRTCWFSEAEVGEDGGISTTGRHEHHAEHSPATTLYALERTIAQRRAEAGRPTPEGSKPSWTARLLADPALLCKKVREEAGELCQTLEEREGAERAANEMADLLYHSMVLLNLQVRRAGWWLRRWGDWYGQGRVLLVGFGGSKGCKCGRMSHNCDATTNSIQTTLHTTRASRWRR